MNALYLAKKYMIGKIDEVMINFNFMIWFYKSIIHLLEWNTNDKVSKVTTLCNSFSQI